MSSKVGATTDNALVPKAPGHETREVAKEAGGRNTESADDRRPTLPHLANRR
ncbi:hypothetical protein [Streptomyces litmocidini]|uniref:hypothetical protein n=1 Tax=Streptomyces litmocidini TaxID=67318 RepID=UPI003701618E